MSPFKISGGFDDIPEVFIALKDGEEYHEKTGGKHEEGYSVTYSTYRREGNVIELESIEDSRDCDGFRTETRNFVWDFTKDGVQEENGFPNWRADGGHNMDRNAEAAGY